MKTQIKCPSCGHKFNLEDVLTEDVEKSIREKYEAQHKEVEAALRKRQQEFERQQQDFEEKKKRENELFADKLKAELEKLGRQKEEEIRKKVKDDSQSELDFLKNEIKEKSDKLKALGEKELEVLQLKKALQEQQEQEIFKLQKQRLELEAEVKARLSDEILGKEREKHELEKRELEKQLNDQKKLTEQMTRKLEQGSMQSQGEVQETALEDILRNAFPYDEVREVPKGSTGADCILVVKNEFGAECGKVVFESKRTKNFNREWISKLKADALLVSADVSILVTQIMPDDLKHFDQRDGVWICKLNEVIQLVRVIREGVINVARASRSQENKGEKKEMLYNYFTSSEFRQQMRAINEAYLYLKSSIDRERLQMEKIWKEREKQIDKVLHNNTHLLGSISGITGVGIDEQDLLE